MEGVFAMSPGFMVDFLPTDSEVKKGDVLATVSNPKLKADLDKSRSDLAFLRVVQDQIITAALSGRKTPDDAQSAAFIVSIPDQIEAKGKEDRHAPVPGGRPENSAGAAGRQVDISGHLDKHRGST